MKVLFRVLVLVGTLLGSSGLAVGRSELALLDGFDQCEFFTAGPDFCNVQLQCYWDYSQKLCMWK